MLPAIALRRTSAIAAHLRTPQSLAAPRLLSSASSVRAPANAVQTSEDEKSDGYYKHWMNINTRWKDNDQYGHINNVEYYSYFDTVVNTYLITQCGLDPAAARTSPPTTTTTTTTTAANQSPPRIFYVVSSGARYHAPASFPDTLRAGMRVAKLGTSSVVYHVGVFKGGVGKGESTCVVTGEFVHVCVDARSGRPIEIERGMREMLEKLK
ncbi:putative thioesterase [Powellomyces hirtus]|nr:putative thioesterase [Powellomyces hirtus]